MLNRDKGIIEAALFVAGEPLDEERLSALLKGRPVKEAVQELIQDYKDRDSAIEIVELEGKYVMQVKAGYAEEVRDVAPRELPPPILRTLSMIAYHQPLTQSDLVRIRGNSAYPHVRELEERGLISVAPKGRTRLLQNHRQRVDCRRRHGRPI
jgi:segregation and condensation protein B